VLGKSKGNVPARDGLSDGEIESRKVYFEEPTLKNREATFRHLRERLKGSGIKKLDLTSTTRASICSR
jgi:hypothetical protein